MTNGAQTLSVARSVARAALRIAAAHWRRILLLFGGVLLPLIAFGLIAEDIWTEHGVGWDRPVLETIHARATPAADGAMILISRIGYLWGTVPAVIAVLAVLVLRRRVRDALFFAAANGGSALLNRAAKLTFHRTRPSLWLSAAPETTFSFPSGHSMGSMALVAALAVLAWPTRWRWPAIGGGALYVVLVSFSRLYLGVHYPSDVLAAWAAALAWVLGVSTVLYGRPVKQTQ